MNINDAILKNGEKAVFGLRTLYQKYGYAPYKMSKFEEYDLYVRNKNFLRSDHIITFTDTSGKLMALKPDVTLSIVRNSKPTPGGVQKVYYHENVYRVSKGSGVYREIMQAGLECIGDIDAYCIFEVLLLAVLSLTEISSDFVLDISHLGLVSALLEEAELSPDGKQQLLRCIGEKNAHGIDEICDREATPAPLAKNLKRLITACGKAEDVLPVLSDLSGNGAGAAAVAQLTRLTNALREAGVAEHIRIDLSVINDMNYYNGIVFQGFVNGIPASILSGGQYDRLMQKMGKRAGAIGFAVYLDLLEALAQPAKQYDVDTVLLYTPEDDPSAVARAVRRLIGEGKSVMAQKSVPPTLKYRQLIGLNEEGVKILEDNA